MRKLIPFILSIMISLFLLPLAYASSKDSINPVVTNTYPKKCEMNVMIESKIIMRFNVAIQKGNAISKISFKEASKTYTGFTYEIKNNILKLTPKKALKYDTEYIITIPSKAVKDMSGNNLEDKFVLRFITEEKASVQDSGIEEQKETGESSHIIEIEAIMEDSFTDEEEAYLIETLKSIGVIAKKVNVKKLESEDVEDTQEIVEASEEELAQAEMEGTNEVETTAFDVIMVDCGSKKIQVIRVIREVTTMGLKEAKDLVDLVYSGVPQIVKENIPRDEAEAVAESLEEVGATVSIVAHE